MSSSEGPLRETELLRMQVDTFYQVNKFISSIDNLEELLQNRFDIEHSTVQVECQACGAHALSLYCSLPLGNENKPHVSPGRPG